MPTEFELIFERLRKILEKHAGRLSVKDESPHSYSLEAAIGPATLEAWGGKARRACIPVAWVQTGKAYLSYHLMGIYENTKLHERMSKELKARMQGKTCFNFKTIDEALFKELDELTGQAIAAFANAGFVTLKGGARERT